MVSSIPDQKNLIPLSAFYCSKGGKKLTGDEKNELSKEYDVNDMTASDELGLLGKLTEDGVVSSADFSHAFSEQLPNFFCFDRTMSDSELKAYDQSVQKVFTTQKKNFIDYYENAANSTKDLDEAAFDIRLKGIFSQLA